MVPLSPRLAWTFLFDTTIRTANPSLQAQNSFSLVTTTEDVRRRLKHTCVPDVLKVCVEQQVDVFSNISQLQSVVVTCLGKIPHHPSLQEVPQALQIGSPTSSIIIVNSGSPSGLCAWPTPSTPCQHMTVWPCTAPPTPSWRCQRNSLQLYVCKVKKPIAGYMKNTLISSNRKTMDRVSRFRFLCLHTEDLTWTHHTISQTEALHLPLETEEAHHGLEDTLQLLHVTHYTSNWTSCIAGWRGSCPLNRKSLQRLAEAAQNVTRSEPLQVQHWRKKAG